MLSALRQRLGLSADRYCVMKMGPEQFVVEDHLEAPPDPFEWYAESDEAWPGTWQCQHFENGDFGEVVWRQTLGDLGLLEEYQEMRAERDDLERENSRLQERNDALERELRTAERGSMQEEADGSALVPDVADVEYTGGGTRL